MCVDAVLEDYYKSSAVDKGETRVITKENLTAWELYVLNDLMFQIAMKKCTKVNRPAAIYLKDFVTQSLKQGQTDQPQSPEFLPTYSKLVGCFDYLNAMSKTPRKKLDESVTFVNKGPENKIVIVNPKPHKLKYTRRDHENGNFIWINKVSNMVSKLWKRDSVTTEDPVNVPPQTDIERSIRKDSQAKRKFHKFLLNINRVVRTSCPSELQPAGYFSKAVINDIMSWVSRDVHGLTATALKYFQSKSILDEIGDCLKTL